MKYTRIIPSLLIQGKALVKTINFSNPTYLGDPFNTIRLFNGKEVDEIIVIDIDATRQNRGPNFELIRKISSECFMPICYGGGLNNLQDVEKIFNLGIDKVSFNSSLISNINLITETVRKYGSQAVVASIDYKKINGRYVIFTQNGSINTKIDLIAFLDKLDNLKIGEFLVTSIDNEGTFNGYDEFLLNIINRFKTPIAINGGANSLETMIDAIRRGASAAVAGSLFSFYGRKKAVIPNYPERSVIEKILETLKVQ